MRLVAARRCAFCSRPAVVYLRYARLPLCEKHFKEYIEKRVAKTLERYQLVKSGERVVAAVSGGKDSVTMAATLAKIVGSDRLLLLYIDLGIPGYSEKLRRKVEELAQKLNTKLLVIGVEETLGVKSIHDFAVKAKRPTCSVCGLFKRYVMNAVAVELNAVLATGHTLDDAVAYILKDFISQSYEQLRKWVPRTEAQQGAAPRIRPLIETSERETLLYALLAGLPFLHEECPYRPENSIEDATKDYMNKLEENHPGIKLSFLRNFVKNVEKHIAAEEAKPQTCKYCGLISQGEVCSFCRLTEKVFGKPLGPKIRAIVREKLHKLGLAEKHLRLRGVET